MKLVLKKTCGNCCGQYVMSLKRSRMFCLTNDLDKARKFEDVPEILNLVAKHDDNIGYYVIVKVDHSGWCEQGELR